MVKRGRGHPRAYLLPSPVGKATDPEETFRPAVCPRSKVSPDHTYHCTGATLHEASDHLAQP